MTRHVAPHPRHEPARRALADQLARATHQGTHFVAGAPLGSQLIHLRQTEWIVLPVRLEFLAGRRTEEPLEVVQAFLDEFALADEGTVLPDDWRVAENYANRILSNRPRDLGDCLILAIADRLGFDIDTFDGGMPRSGAYRGQAKSRQRKKRRKKR